MSKPDTISEVLENFYTWCLCGNDECRLYLNYAESLATIEKLLLEVIGDNEEYTIVSHEYNTDNGAVKQTIGDGEQEWKDPRNELRAEQRTTLKAVLYGEKK